MSTATLYRLKVAQRIKLGLATTKLKNSEHITGIMTLKNFGILSIFLR